MNIASGIKDLLYIHDCVIIPNFGGFLLNYQSATIHPVTHTFAPPSKTLAFNKNLLVNDGLLANHLARKYKITYDEALSAINVWVRSVRGKLEKGESFVIEDAGTFMLDAEENLQFIPDETTNYYGGSFGLGSFSSPAILRTRVAEEKNTPVPVVPVATKQRSTFRQLRRVAAIFLPAAIITGAVLVSLLNTDKGLDDKISYSGILVSCNRATTADKAAEKPSEALAVVTDSDASLPDTPPDTSVYVETKEVPPPPPPTNQPPEKTFDDPSRRFHSRFKSPDTPETRHYIIIGSYNTLDAAEKKVEELRTSYYEDSFVVSMSKIGTYRVSAVSYFGFDKAKIQLQTIKKQLNKDAWILQM